MVTGIQVNDGTEVPRTPTTTRTAWPTAWPPGDGEFDLAGFVGALRPTGSQLVARGVQHAGVGRAHAHIERIADGMRGALAAA